MSLASAGALLGLKLAAWWVSGSTALLADSLESIVNVVAAGFATYTIGVAARPPDSDHPYGHGKAEFLSAAFEGALILIAATLIVAEAIHRLADVSPLDRVGLGVLLATAAGAGNAALGVYLLRVGRDSGSPALLADGRHVLSDVATTLGSVLGLGLVAATGVLWIDPVVALAVALHIVVAGWRVGRSALGGLLDEADFEFLQRIAERLRADTRPDWIEIHQLRTWRSGSFRHIDLHVVVPRYYTIEIGHRLGDALEATLLDLVGGQGDVVVHVDPCRPLHCSRCRVADCPVRAAAFEERAPFNVKELTREGRV